MLQWMWVFQGVGVTSGSSVAQLRNQLYSNYQAKVSVRSFERQRLHVVNEY